MSVDGGGLPVIDIKELIYSTYSPVVALMVF